MTCPYSMVIQWSDEDQAYVVSLPEFGPYCKTHGNSYEEAARMGQEALESVIEAYKADGWPLPAPVTLQTSPDLSRFGKRRRPGRQKTKA